MSVEDDTDTNRRDALRKILQGAGALGLTGLGWGNLVSGKKKSDLTLRPPAAIYEKDFIKACIKCGSCVEACPYDTLKLSTKDDNTIIGTPYFVARETPCYMCPDIPCVPVFPSGALDAEALILKETEEKEMNINEAQMGLAVVHEESCIAFWGIQCDACYRACPLMGEAITLDYERNERTGKHAFLKPNIITDICTGCGMCEHACVTEIPAIKVLPRTIAMGKVGDHYIKGWDESDESRINTEEESEKTDNDEVPAEDYLNNWEDLLDD